MAKRKSETPNRGKTPLEWRRMDLHIHTPASLDYLDPGVTYLDLLQRAEARGLDIMAFTDHNTVAGYRTMRAEIEQLELLERLDRLRPEERRRLDEYRRLLSEILVLPGFEFTAMFGFHILCIFSPETRVRELEHLLLKLNIPPDRLDRGATEVGASSDVLTVYRSVREVGGIVIAAHANSANGVAMRGFSFGGQTKIAFTQDPSLHALEVTDLDQKGPRTTQNFFNGSKPEYPRRMRCIQGSDAHRVRRDPANPKQLGIGDRMTEVALPEVSFAALKELFEGEDWTRSRAYRGPDREPVDEIRQAREVGPNIVQAFHEGVSRRGGRLYSIIADVVAFANTNGGTVYIGCMPGTKTPPIGVEQPELNLEQLRHELQSQITPPLNMKLDLAESEGKKIIRVTVPRGTEPPYALEQNRIYVRDEAETSLAARDEIVQLVKRGLGLVSPAAPLLGPAPVMATVTPMQPTVVQTSTIASVSPSMNAVSVARTAPAPMMEPDNNNKGLVPPPRTGVEIVAVEDRDGVRYHTMRDLRNGNVVHNVTKKSARKLWHYAIQRYEQSAFDPKTTHWQGDIALLGSNSRQGQIRYDVAQRRNGEIRVYYGVTEDGFHGPWRKLLGTMEEEQIAPAAATTAIAEPETEPEIEAGFYPPADEAQALQPGPVERVQAEPEGHGPAPVEELVSLLTESGLPEVVAEVPAVEPEQLVPASQPPSKSKSRRRRADKKAEAPARPEEPIGEPPVAPLAEVTGPAPKAAGEPVAEPPVMPAEQDAFVPPDVALPISSVLTSAPATVIAEPLAPLPPEPLSAAPEVPELPPAEPTVLAPTEAPAPKKRRSSKKAAEKAPEGQPIAVPETYVTNGHAPAEDPTLEPSALAVPHTAVPETETVPEAKPKSRRSSSKSRQAQAQPETATPESAELSTPAAPAKVPVLAEVAEVPPGDAVAQAEVETRAKAKRSRSRKTQNE